MINTIFIPAEELIDHPPYDISNMSLNWVTIGVIEGACKREGVKNIIIVDFNESHYDAILHEDEYKSISEILGYMVERILKRNKIDVNVNTIYYNSPSLLIQCFYYTTQEQNVYTITMDDLIKHQKTWSFFFRTKHKLDQMPDRYRGFVKRMSIKENELSIFGVYEDD